MIWYRMGRERTWTVIPNDTNLREFASTKLEALSHQDSDNGYKEFIEFYDGLLGVRTYGCAVFASYYEEDHGGTMEEFDYGTFEGIIQVFGKHAVHAHPYAPDRDWLLVGRFQ
ncbi:MAG: hypothetical protein EOO77_39415 [Oxalobacteraceae bacterium]|nr:MAG: hypothetical protein EOO77_39415 [Oxalobacteraceae bacterium]